MEQFFSGYCRALDAARTVLFDEEGADCAWPACTFAESCPVAEQLRKAAEENMGV